MLKMLFELVFYILYIDIDHFFIIFLFKQLNYSIIIQEVLHYLFFLL